MIPDNIRFTGLTVPSSALLFEGGSRRVQAPYPANLIRYQIPNKHFDSKMLEKVNKWLEDTISGRWGSYMSRDQLNMVIMFEDADDAILFKLLDGDTAWNTQAQG
jgi:hypothetical protein